MPCGRLSYALATSIRGLIELVRIVTSKFGDVCEKSVSSILRVMNECYKRLEPHEVELVDLYIFEHASTAHAFLLKESIRAGVTSTFFGEKFFAMHDAWKGTPRITLCLDRIEVLPKLVQLGGIRHEVGHSVLHGSLKYYVLSLPPSLSELAKRFSLPLPYLMDMLYLISIAVKDYEVSRLLYERGYVEDQVAYVRHLLNISESDILSWGIARGSPMAEALCLASCLKTIGCATPFLYERKLNELVRNDLIKSLSYLPREHSTRLLNVFLEEFPSLGKDTLTNIDHIAQVVADKLVKPILKAKTSSGSLQL